jgi:poly-gamma-glutamate capsule biosynthesis protein CapA/YwtB (metallophosphatase superfamily)
MISRQFLGLVASIGFVVAIVRPAPAEEQSGRVRLIMVGDIMIANDQETGEIINRGVDPFTPFAEVLKNADVAIGNLECVVAEHGEPVEKPYRYLADPKCLPRLKQHFTAFSLANNHSGDFGKAAFARECDLLDQAGIKYFGGGRNKAEAHRPWIIERNGVRIAMLGYCEVFLRSFEALDNVPGVAWSAYDDEVLADIKAAREKYRAHAVIPFMHWGYENDVATDREKTFARQMIDAGADVVVGAHPHVTQGAEYYRGHLIVYSLGNFLFNGFDEEPTLRGWALRLTVDKKGMVDWDTVVARLDDHGVPHPDLAAKSPKGRVGSSEIAETTPQFDR